MNELTIFILFILFIVLPIILTRVRKVPPNTTIIIDRNTHFHKKKKHGYYWINPVTDIITTIISTNEVTQSYKNIFKTHDDNYYELTYSFSYKATDVDMVLSSLQDSRRSIYDIVNCSVETVVASLSQKDMLKLDSLRDLFFKQLEAMLEPFYIDATKFKLIYYRRVEQSYGIFHKFNKHVSTSDNPVGGSSTDSVTYSNNTIGDYATYSNYNADGDDPFRKL